MINFPLYELRKYVEIFEEGIYVIITTHKTRYILDYVDVDGLHKSSSYSDRRISLLGDTFKPYNMYPLNKRIESLNQMMLTKHKSFIDCEGKLVNWKPKKFYPVVCVPIKSRWTTPKGLTGIEVKGLSTKFIVSDGNYKYAQVLQVGWKNILVDLCNELRPPTRKKL